MGLVSSARAAPPSVGVGGSHSESSRPARCVLGAVPRPALAPLLPAAAGVGGDGLLGRRAPRRSAEGFAVAGLSLAFFGGREHAIAERGPSAIHESTPVRLRTPIRAMVAFLQPSSLRLCTKMATAVFGAGPVSDAVLSTRRARRTAPSNQKDSCPLLDFASVLEDAS